MAANEKKRSFSQSGSDHEQPPRKQSATSNFEEEEQVMDSFSNFVSLLEPLLRRVVSEEVEHGVRKHHNIFHSLQKTPSLSSQALKQSSFKLMFCKKLSLPIFTGSRIIDIETNPLQILVVETKSGTGGSHIVPPVTNLTQPIKIDIVVLDGDFPPGEGQGYKWSKEEFENSIVKERIGKRPLLAGDVTATARDGVAPVGEIEFTDNSSWIRSRKFRIGARVAVGDSPSGGVRISEAFTEAFVVKDHRGELYKKHYPPMLEDEVWRLEKIGRGGAFNRRLEASGIKTVQDILKMSVVEPQKLRRILGAGMSQRIWEVIMQHARTCELGKKLYILRGHNCDIILNPICQVVRANIDGLTFSAPDLQNLNRGCVESLVREAYSNWRSLEAVEGALN